ILPAAPGGVAANPDAPVCSGDSPLCIVDPSRVAGLEAWQMRGRTLLIVGGIVLGLGALFAALISRYPNAFDGEGGIMRLVAMLGWLFLAGGAGFAFIRAQPGTALRNIAIWVAIGLVLVAGYSLKDDIGGALMPSGGTEGPGGEIVFRRANDGHFHVEAEVDGRPIRFLVDTGATDVVLSQD